MRLSGRVVLIGLLASCAGLIRGDARVRLYSDLPAPHESPIADPWIRPQVREIAQKRSAVSFAGYTSTQVNTTSFGCDVFGDAASETTIAVDPNDPRRMVIGWRQFDSADSGFRQAEFAYSHDGGYSWENAGPIEVGVFGSDPVIDCDARGVFYCVSINVDRMILYRSFDGGRTWPASTLVYEGFFDKPWMGVTRFGGDDPTGVAICNGRCFVSDDGGTSFADIGERPATGKLTQFVLPSGRLYSIGAVVGASFGLTRFDGLGNGEPVEPRLVGTGFFDGGWWVGIQGQGLMGQLWPGYDPSGEVFHVVGTIDRGDAEGSACGLEFRIMATRSLDGGVTWSEPVPVSGYDDPGYSKWFGTMSVAPNGRVDVIWNDHRRSQACQVWQGRFEMLYSRSTDRGVSFSEPVPLTGPQEYIMDPTLKIGDYYQMHSDNLGANLAYAGTFKGAPDIYFLRIGPWDCNGNEIDDAADISGGASLDVNGNDVPDECEFRGDADGDDLTTLLDLADMQACFTGDGGTFAGGIATTVDAEGLTPSGGDPPSEGILYTDPACSLFDLEPDGDVDLIDAERILAVMQGPGFSCR